MSIVRSPWQIAIDNDVRNNVGPIRPTQRRNNDKRLAMSHFSKEELRELYAKTVETNKRHGINPIRRFSPEEQKSLWDLRSQLALSRARARPVTLVKLKFADES